MKLIIIFLLMLFATRVSIAETIDLGKVEANTVTIVHVPGKIKTIFNVGAGGSFATSGTYLQTPTYPAISMSGNLDYKLYDKGNTWFEARIGEGYNEINVIKQTHVKFVVGEMYGIPYDGKTPDWWRRIHLSNLNGGYPAETKTLISEWTYHSWKVDTRSAKYLKPGIYTEAINASMHNQVWTRLYLKFEVVNKLNARCNLTNLEGGNIITLGHISAGKQTISVDKIQLQCTDVYRAKVSLSMNDTLSNSGGYRTKTVAGGYLEIQDNDNQRVKIDGSTTYLINPSMDHIVKFKIVNNAENVLTGGEFRKTLNIKVRID